MEIVRGIEELPISATATAVTIGFFDGVHRGHQAVIGRTVEIARERGLDAVAVTFDRHPREVFAPGTEPKLLTALDRKAKLVASLGVDTLAVLEFTEDFSRWPPEEFARKVLADGLHAEHAVIGSNFTFGYRATGNLPVLTDLGAACGFTVEGVALLKLDGRAVSSSSIREALAAGALTWPARALGRRFAVDGVVVPGAGRGAGLGYPTANLAVPGRMLLPAEGVYAGRALVAGAMFPAAVNVGTNPTFGGEPLHVEAYLLDFDGELHGQPITVEFWERLRDEARFESADALAEQISHDVDRTRALTA